MTEPIAIVVPGVPDRRAGLADEIERLTAQTQWRHWLSGRASDDAEGAPF